MNRPFHRPQDRSGVLILTLLVLVLISVIVLGLLASVTMERQSTESNYQQRRALSLAMLGFQTGVAQLRDALGTNTASWDNPYGNFASNTPSFYWSVSPGILTHWSYTQPNPVTNYPLFSYTTDNNNTALADLNRPLSDGSYPIIGLSDSGPGATTAPSVDVKFVNVLQDPSQSPGPDNKIVGRYAFWIDDESAKININVADGSRQKYSADWMKNSLGLGNLTEESLQVLPQAGASLSNNLASNIVYVARSESFHSPREILRVPNTTSDLYTNNVFDLTDDSKSADINLFGQPKMAILPVLGSGAGEYQYETDINGITLRPVTEIYPSYSQLAQYVEPSAMIGYGPNNNDGNVDYSMPYGFYYQNYPLVFHAMGGPTATGFIPDLSHVTYYGTALNYGYNNGYVIAHYLNGDGCNSNVLTWPAFQGSNPAAFKGKYTPRQIDDLSAQIVSLGCKMISSDYPFANNVDYPEDSQLLNQTPPYPAGSRFDETPWITPGWLSRQFVLGFGRTAKVSRLSVQVDTHPGETNIPSAGQWTPPYANFTIFLEEWIPGAYRGGTADYNFQGSWTLGENSYPGPLSPADQWFAFRNNAGGTPYPTPSMLPTTNGAGQTNNIWANQMLTNNQGLDMSGDTNGAVDPDQVSAGLYHNPWPWMQGSQYEGSASVWTPALEMNNLRVQGETAEWGANIYHEGAMRAVVNVANPANGSGANYYMTPSANNLYIGGGIAINDIYHAGEWSPGDPTPFETMRGCTPNYGPANAACVFSYDISLDGINANPAPIYSWTFTDGMTGTPNPGIPNNGGSGSDLRARHIASVIPVNISVKVDSFITDPTQDNSEGESQTVYLSAPDPLVNKFPGDWVQSTNTYPPLPDTTAGTEDLNNYSYYSETNFLANMRTNGGDAESYWLPQSDVDRTYSTNAILAQTLIPRSARMPNVGYLQYMRTGIIPDNEGLDYYPAPGEDPSRVQHGTPWRLLSLGPCNSSDPNQTVHNVNYPDWAMLDLFYVPSCLNSFGGPYATNSNLASFGTYGGATAGRINPNGCVIYTTNTTNPAPNIFRTLPLQSTFYGLSVNQKFNGTVDQPQLWPYTNDDTLQGNATLDQNASFTLASNIAQFISTNGPLREPAEICNIPFVTNYYAPENALHTRNDLVRQMIGQLTTQSNTYSVWTVGQVIQKAPGNHNYGEFESGDLVTGEVRMHFILERYLDPGADGVYGNTGPAGPGADGVIGTLDDPMDPTNHPFEPKFLYRVVRSEELR